MAKIPKDSPTAEGQRVVLRGRGAVGTVTRMDDAYWVWVDWDEGQPKAPKICFITELSRCS